MVDVLIILMYIAISVAICSTLWSIYYRIRVVGRTSGMVHGIPVRRINIIVVSAIVLIMLLSFIIGDTQPLHINAKTFSDTFWLRMSNMFVFTGITAILAATCSMIYSYYIIIRKKK